MISDILQFGQTLFGFRLHHQHHQHHHHHPHHYHHHYHRLLICSYFKEFAGQILFGFRLFMHTMEEEEDEERYNY